MLVQLNMWSTCLDKGFMSMVIDKTDISASALFMSCSLLFLSATSILLFNGSRYYSSQNKLPNENAVLLLNIWAPKNISKQLLRKLINAEQENPN